MTYVLVKRYNLAYDYFLFRYFKENGIDVNENSTLKEVERVALSFQKKVEIAAGKRPLRSLSLEFIRKLPPPEGLLWDYAWSWKMEPECRPSTDYKFEGIFGGKFPDIKKLRELELQLPSKRGKLLFSKAEAAGDIMNFYKGYMRDPLRTALNEDPSVRKLLNFFSIEDHRRLSNVAGEGKVRDETRKVAEELLASMIQLKPADIANQIDFLLNEHWKDSEHPRAGVSIADQKKKMRSCEHKSNFLQLNYYHYVDDNVESLYLKPSRGFRVWETRNWENVYVDVIFPQYRVMKLQS